MKTRRIISLVTVLLILFSPVTFTFGKEKGEGAGMSNYKRADELFAPKTIRGGGRGIYQGD